MGSVDSEAPVRATAYSGERFASLGARQTGGPSSNDANSWFYHGFALNAYVPQSATALLGSRTISDFATSGFDLHDGGDSSADAFTAAARQERYIITMVKNDQPACRPKLLAHSPLQELVMEATERQPVAD